MPSLPLPHHFRKVTDPNTGRIISQHDETEWFDIDLLPGIRTRSCEQAYNGSLALCSGISQEDRDKVASVWAEIRLAREAHEKMMEEVRAKEAKAERRRKAEGIKKRVLERKEEEEKIVRAEAVEAEREKGRKINAMLEECEGVAMNIAKVEKKPMTEAEDEGGKKGSTGEVMDERDG